MSLLHVTFTCLALPVYFYLSSFIRLVYLFSVVAQIDRYIYLLGASFG